MKNVNQIFGLLGVSLSHSLSPLIHNYLISKFELNASYSLFEIKKNNLKKALESIRILGLNGVNVTYPYKLDAVKYLDKLDKSAQLAGAVNTIANRSGILTGYNTDIYGIKSTIADRLKINPRGNNVLIIGAGGSSRAAITALIETGIKSISIMNRTAGKADKLCKEFGVKSKSVEFISIGLTEVEPDRPFDLIINAINPNQKLVSNLLCKLDKTSPQLSSSFLDLNYGELAYSGKSPEFVKKYSDGLYMLTAQAARSFEIWTGCKISPVDLFKSVNRKIKNIG